MAQLQIENDFLSSSFSILEEQPMDMLLGLDMLKRHQCQIDLKRNVLVFGTTGTETKFLTESELPECAKLSSKAVSMEEALAESAKEAERRDVERAVAESKRHKGEDTSSAASGSTSTSTEVVAGDKFTEDDVKKLVGYGFERAKVLEELRAQNGDVTQATAALFAKSLKM